MRIFDFTPDGQRECCVTAWIHTEVESAEMASRQLPAVVICPGGGYGFVSDREADPVAQVYFSQGYNTFILKYSIGERAKDFTPLCQLAATVAQVRGHADEWHVDPNRIAVWGGSAGDHLAGSLGTLYNTAEFQKIYARHEDVRPNAMILIYPVITADEYAHVDSIRRVSGEDVGHPRYEWFGLNKHVDKHTPPTFLYHTADDNCVPVQNSLQFADALSRAGVTYEMHILPRGGHGMSVSNQAVGCLDDYTARWTWWSIEWLNKTFEFRG